MRRREFQRRAAAAFLPARVLPRLGHHFGPVGRMLGWLAERVLPAGGGPGERGAEVLGGAGVAKAAVAGGAVLLAGASLATSIPRLVAPTTHHAQQVHRVRGHAVAHRAAISSLVSQAPTAVVSHTPPAGSTSGGVHLTSQQHAELEFSSLQAGGSSRTDAHGESEPTASIASAPKQAQAGTALESNEADTPHESESSVGEHEPQVDSGGPSQAAREFGQP